MKKEINFKKKLNNKNWKLKTTIWKNKNWKLKSGKLKTIN